MVRRGEDEAEGVGEGSLGDANDQRATVRRVTLAGPWWTPFLYSIVSQPLKRTVCPRWLVSTPDLVNKL